MSDSNRPSLQPPHPPVVGTTLREHVLLGMRAAAGASGEFTSLLNHISLAVRIITSRVRSAGLADMLGYTGDTNVQGEEVQKLDDYANEVLLTVLERSGHCCLLASEELDDALFNDKSGKYVVLFDPLDGSSNIDTNVSIGTIFAVYRRRTREGKPILDDALQPGREIAAAGYALYGPSTIFVLTMWASSSFRTPIFAARLVAAVFRRTSATTSAGLRECSAGPTGSTAKTKISGFPTDIATSGRWLLMRIARF
jgi:fructose-1,6-bisphosphatase I